MFMIIIVYSDSDNSERPTSVASGAFGFKLVGDNIDFTINARYVRTDGRQTRSLHYFHFFAIRDRIDMSQYDFDLPQKVSLDPEKIALKLLPSIEDDTSLVKDIAILLSRILVTYIPFFKFTFADVVSWHIEHKFYKEMSKKSEAVRIIYLSWFSCMHVYSIQRFL